jgi:hypothetical protein
MKLIHFTMSLLILALSFASRGRYQLRAPSYRTNPMQLYTSALSSDTSGAVMQPLTKEIKSSVEQQLKNALITRQEARVIDIISAWNVSSIPIRSSARSSVNRLLQLCADVNRHEYANLIINNLNPRFYTGVTDYEIIPFLQSCTIARKNTVAFDAVKHINEKGLQVSAKAVSILVQGMSSHPLTTRVDESLLYAYLIGFGKARNEKAIDEVLKYCIDQKISMDLIFLHNLMDAYIK